MNSMHIKPLRQTQLRWWQGTSAGKQTQTCKHSHHLRCEVSKKVIETGSLSTTVTNTSHYQTQRKKGLFIHTVADKRAASRLHSLTARAFPLPSPQFHSLQKKMRAKIIACVETERDTRGAAWLSICSVIQTHSSQTVDCHIRTPQSQKVRKASAKTQGSPLSCVTPRPGPH